MLHEQYTEFRQNSMVILNLQCFPNYIDNTYLIPRKMNVEYYLTAKKKPMLYLNPKMLSSIGEFEPCGSRDQSSIIPPGYSGIRITLSKEKNIISV